MGYPAHDEDEIDGAVAADLVGDVHVTAAGVLHRSGCHDRRGRGRRDLGSVAHRCGLFDVGDEAVAAPMSGLDESRSMGVVTERSPDFTDADLQRPVGNEYSRPDGVEQFRFANQVARASGEVLQQRERFGGQGDRPGVSVELAPGRVDAKTIEGEHAVRRHGSEGAKSLDMVADFAARPLACGHNR